jgi:hypothetical protein
LAIDKKATNLSFGDGWHAVSEFVAYGVNGSIWGWRFGWGFVWMEKDGAEKMVISNEAASLGQAEIGSVAVDVKDHVTGDITDGCVRKGGAIIEQLDDFVGSVLCAFGLF